MSAKLKYTTSNGHEYQTTDQWKIVSGECCRAVVDPASGKISDGEQASKTQIDAAVEAARAAFDGWAATPRGSRRAAAQAR
jgi:acyl-CoA reductase-like NAD-dependent aldehyde dehydrogenase